MNRQQIDDIAQRATHGLRMESGEKLDTIFAYTIIQNYIDIYKSLTRQTYTGDIAVTDVMSILDVAFCRWDKVYTISQKSVLDYFNDAFKNPNRRENEIAARESTFADYARFMRSKAITSRFLDRN